jgi:hypothetical protein
MFILELELVYKADNLRNFIWIVASPWTTSPATACADGAAILYVLLFSFVGGRLGMICCYGGLPQAAGDISASTTVTHCGELWFPSPLHAISAPTRLCFCLW